MSTQPVGAFERVVIDPAKMELHFWTWSPHCDYIRRLAKIREQIRVCRAPRAKRYFPNYRIKSHIRQYRCIVLGPDTMACFLIQKIGNW